MTKNGRLIPRQQSARDWSEDFSYENGNYCCRCCVCEVEFTGHKRRVICKQCSGRSEVEMVGRVLLILFVLTISILAFAVPFVRAEVPDFKVRSVKAKAKATHDDLTRIGCKLRPDLGSGVNTDRGVVTCSHCIKGTTVQVECDGEIAAGIVVARDAATDVALVAVDWKKPHPRVSLASKVTGPLSLVARSADGSIGIQSADLQGPTFDGKYVIAQPTIGGQSGGGYIDSDGHLAGIVSGNIADREPFRGLMIPVDAIRKLLPSKAATAHAGQHSHICSKGHEWWHGDESFGNRNAHTCPVCGEVQWDVSRKAPVAAVKPLPIPVLKSAGGNCPGGVCPLPLRKRR